MNTPDPQPPYLSTSPTEIEHTPKKQTGADDGTEQATATNGKQKHLQCYRQSDFYRK
jgi:hypothetical protein